MRGRTTLYHSFINLQCFFLRNGDVLFTSFSSAQLIPLINDMANEPLHGGFIDSFMKFLNNSFQVRIICLPVMTSACIFKDTSRNNAQVFLKLKISILVIGLHSINFNFTPHFLTSSMLTSKAGISKEIPPDEKWIIINRNSNHLFIVNS